MGGLVTRERSSSGGGGALQHLDLASRLAVGTLMN